jgi:Domain of unknown function (DUF4129)
MKRRGAGPEMRTRIFLAVVMVASCLPCCAQSPTGSEASAVGNAEFDLQSYRRELSRIEETSQNVKDIRDLRRSLPDSWTVKDGDRIYRVPTKEIADALAQIEHDPKKTEVAAELKSRLQAMQHHAAALALPSSGPTAGEADAKLAKILERGEFQAAAGPSGWDLLKARINRWIFEHILRLLRLLHIREKTGNLIAWAVIVVAVVLLFYVVYVRLFRVSKGVRFKAELEPANTDARHWAQEALAAAEKGDYREAIHCAYWATVARLEDLRVLPMDRSRTPRESLRLLEQHPREQSVLGAITRNFELIWYGYRPASATEWAGAKEQMEKLGCLQVSIAPTATS